MPTPDGWYTNDEVDEAVEGELTPKAQLALARDGRIFQRLNGRAWALLDSDRHPTPPPPAG